MIMNTKSGIALLGVLLMEGCSYHEAPNYPGTTNYRVGYVGYQNFNEYNTYVPYYWGPQHYLTTDDKTTGSTRYTGY